MCAVDVHIRGQCLTDGLAVLSVMFELLMTALRNKNTDTLKTEKTQRAKSRRRWTETCYELCTDTLHWRKWISSFCVVNMCSKSSLSLSLSLSERKKSSIANRCHITVWHWCDLACLYVSKRRWLRSRGRYCHEVAFFFINCIALHMDTCTTKHFL